MTNSGAGGLREVPIIDARSYTDPTGDFHESYHSFKARARLVKANGHANNQVMLRAQGPSFTKIQGEYLAQMDRWLDAIAADTSATPLPEKVVRAKPADLVDACWTNEGQKIAEAGGVRPARQVQQRSSRRARRRGSRPVRRWPTMCGSAR